MAIELAHIRIVPKPWGSTDLRPWSGIQQDGVAIGELWFERADPGAPEPALLMKLLFTRAPLSIQVHPDDAFARSTGRPHGKTEAWYIVSSGPGAEVAVGLQRRVDPAALRSAIEDGSIERLVQWRGVLKDEIVFVPAGTIHAIGAGLVVAEVQQNADTTFRLFDHGRGRELHVESAMAVAHPGPAAEQPAQRRLTDARTLLVASPYFVLERIHLAPRSAWELRAAHETWVLVLAGDARIGTTSAHVGQAIFVEAERTTIEAGTDGLKALAAYAATEAADGMLRRSGTAGAFDHSHDATVGTRH